MRRRPGKSQVPFTENLWEKWLKRADEDKQVAVELRKGIEEFRRLLARYDIRSDV